MIPTVLYRSTQLCWIIGFPGSGGKRLHIESTGTLWSGPLGRSPMARLICACQVGNLGDRDLVRSGYVGANTQLSTFHPWMPCDNSLRIREDERQEMIFAQRTAFMMFMQDCPYKSDSLMVGYVLICGMEVQLFWETTTMLNLEFTMAYHG